MTRAIEHFIGLGRARGSTAADIASRVGFWLLAGSLSATTLLGQCASSSLTFSNHSVASGTYQALNSITADAGGGSGTTLIGSGTSVTFQAGTSIALLPNFHAEPGSSFQASVPNTAAPAISPTTLSLLGGGGLECATVMIAPGTSWSASTNNSELISFPAGNTGTGSAALTYQVAQNSSTTAGQSATITMTSAGGSATLTVSEAALASGPPTAALQNSLTNGSLPGTATQTLTFTFGSPNGPGYLPNLQVTVQNLFENNSYFACTIDYFPQYNVLYFISQGNLTAYTPGTPGQQASAAECGLNVAASSAVLNPLSTTASVTLNLALTLQPSALGTQSVYAMATDSSGAYSSNWYSPIASWTAFNPVTTAAPAVSLVSPIGSGPSQVLHYEVSDGNGYTYLQGVQGQLASSPSSEANSPCQFSFTYPNLIILYQVASETYTFLGEGYLGGSWSYPFTNGIIGGSGGLAGPGTCSINLNQSTVSTGTDGTGVLQNPNPGPPWQPVTSLYLDLSTSLDSTAQGTLPLNIYLFSEDLTGASDSNANVGAWAPPAISSFSPYFATAGSGQFTLSVVGMNFTPSTVVRISDEALSTTEYLATTFVSANQVTAVIPGSFVASAGSFQVALTVNGNVYSTQSFTVLLSQTISFGAPSSQTLGAPLTISATTSSGLPVTFASSTSAVCTVAGPAVFLLSVGTCTIQASQPGNTNYAAATAVSQSFTVYKTLAISGPNSIPAGAVGSPYSISFSASGGSGAYTWTVFAGALPPGVILSGTGALSGTPSVSGTFSFSVQVNSLGATATSGNYSMYIYPALTISLTNPGPVALVMSPGSWTVSFTGSGGSQSGYTWQVSGLPNTYTMGNDYQYGILSASAATIGTYSFSVHLTDLSGNTATQAYSLAVVAPLTITPQPGFYNNGVLALPAGYVGGMYSATFQATGGVGTYIWSVYNSTLPAGLSLNGQTGVLSGTPQYAGTAQTFEIEVANSTGATFLGCDLTINSSTFAVVGATPLPQGIVGMAYNYEFGTIGGTGNFTWTYNGTLPAGLTLAPSANTGSYILSGTPSAAVTNPATLIISVSEGANSNASFTTSLTINTALAISGPSASLSAVVGTSLAVNFTPSGGSPPYTVLGPSSVIPGVSFSCYFGVICVLNGTPTVAGTYNFSVAVTDANSTSVSNNYTLTVSSPQTLVITTNALPSGDVGSAYSVTLSASGGAPGYTWTPWANSLPSWLSLGINGLLSGTQSAVGSNPFTVQVTDSNGNTASAALSVTVNASLNVTTASLLPAGTMGSAYSVTLAAAGGSGGYVWAFTDSALPSWMSLQNGVLSGTPGSTGTSTFTVQVTDTSGNLASKTLSVTVSATQSLTISNSLPATAYVSVYYIATMLATGGSGTYTWSATGLPSNVTINPTTGEISFTPTAAGSFSVVVTVTDSGTQLTASQTYTLTITSAPATGFAISGYVTTAQGDPLTGALVTLSGGQGAGTTNSGPNGSYSFPSLAANVAYTVSVTLCGYNFPPGTQVTLTSAEPSPTNVVIGATGMAPTREYIHLGGRVIAIANCGAQ